MDFIIHISQTDPLRLTISGFVVILAIIGISFLTDRTIRFVRERTGKSRENRDAKPEWKRPYRTTLENIPIVSYDERNGYYLMGDGSNMDILMIQTKDLITSSEDEVEYDCLKFAKLYKIYSDDLKIVSLNFPCNTLKQQQYFRRRIEDAPNEVHRYWLGRKLKELELLEKNNTTREFYIVFFSKDAEAHESNLTTILTVLSTGRDGLVRKLDAEKKHRILFKINNKNALVS